MAKQDNNRDNQLSPNKDAFWTSRSFDERPDGWEQRLDEDQFEI